MMTWVPELEDHAMRSFVLCSLILAASAPGLVFGQEKVAFGARFSLTKDGKGVFVSGLAAGSPAWELGLRVDDTIKSITLGTGGATFIDRPEVAGSQLADLVRGKGPKYKITIFRYDGREKTTQLRQLTGTVEQAWGTKGGFKVKDARVNEPKRR
jgi:hypothetical protein